MPQLSSYAESRWNPPLLLLERVFENRDTGDVFEEVKVEVLAAELAIRNLHNAVRLKVLNVGGNFTVFNLTQLGRSDGARGVLCARIVDRCGSKERSYMGMAERWG